MKVLKCVLLVLCGFMMQVRVSAQEKNDTARLFATMKELQQMYKQKAISFDIRYTYASELHPGVELDSLAGHMDVSGKNYHYLLSGTEMTANERYVVTLFKEEKIIYLSKPLSAPVDPVQQMWLSMQTIGVTSCSFPETATVKAINIGFKAGSPYKEMQMDFDKKTGYLMEMRYVLKTEMLMASGEGAEDAAAEYGEYAVVRCTYANYKTLSPRPDMFDERKFFYKDGNEYKSTGAYSEYKVFVGAPNL
jgi:hypothetical protein